MTHKITEIVPLFPLSNVVLFPGAHAPLHMFEPRYRQMTQAALDGERRIGMVAVPPEGVPEMAGDPEVFGVGCLGTITNSEALADGRFNIVLFGTDRFRVVREIERDGDRLYRIAEVELLGDTDEGAERVPELRARVLDRFGRLLQAVAPEQADRIGPAVVEEADDSAFVALLAQVLNLPPVERQGILEANGVATRLEILEGLIEYHLAGRTAGDPKGSGSVH